jgi:glycolate oxidase iron-sulfur subunit
MRVAIETQLASPVAAARAEAVIRACVHCGMCNAVCPTFQLTGDELDGPRGRIYLMKNALEGGPTGAESRLHLDRCLECRACETACPSGVAYHRLLGVARPVVERKAGRPWTDRVRRALIRTLALRPSLFRLAVGLGRLVGPIAPALREVIPPPPPQRRDGPARAGQIQRPAAARRMALLGGCVQKAAAPHFNAAAKRLFAKLGIELSEQRGSGCCGAVSFHLGAQNEARALARRNLDAWTVALDAGAEAVTSTASGCAAFIADYPDLMAEDPLYSEKARRVAAALADPAQVVAAAAPKPRCAPAEPRIAVHDPCTLRNGLKLGGQVEGLLAALGYRPQPVRDPHLCCGSAGPYALTQPAFARALRADKLAALTEHEPAAIVTANIGCWTHLAAASPIPVRHWIEAADEVV